MNLKEIASEIELNKNGIWYSKKSEKVSYPSDGNKECFQVEDSSFWFKHRNNCIVSVVKSFPPVGGNPIFDIGGGNGFVAAGIQGAGFDTVLLEPGESGALNGKKRNLKNIICGSTKTCGFKPRSLGAIGLFDVVEHIKDDKSFLAELYSFMKRDSRLYLTVPAYSFLWSYDDVQAGHFRRYSLNQIVRMLEGVGFKVSYSTYIFSILPIPVFIFRTLRYWIFGEKSNASSEDHHRPKSSKIISKMLNLELSLINRKTFIPFGGSCLVVAVKD
jgi:hypothetical protein